MSCEELQARLAEAEATIERLRAEAQQKDAKISELESEKSFLLKGFVGLYNTVSKAYMSLGKAEKQKADTWSRGVNNQPTIEERAAYMEQMGGVMVNALTEAPSASIAATSDENKRFTYSLRTRNENRAEAIVAHATETGKASLDSKEITAVLETHEGRKLDSKTVWRAMELARQLMKAPKDRIGKIVRLKIPDFIRCPEKSEFQDHDSHPWGGGGDRGIVPGPRKDRVLWDPS